MIVSRMSKSELVTLVVKMRLAQRLFKSKQTFKRLQLKLRYEQNVDIALAKETRRLLRGGIRS